MICGLNWTAEADAVLGSGLCCDGRGDGQMDGEETLAKIAEREVEYGVGRRGECDVSVRYLFNFVMV